MIAALTALPSDALIRTDYDRTEVAAVGAAGARVSTQFRTVIGEGPPAFEFGGIERCRSNA